MKKFHLLLYIISAILVATVALAQIRMHYQTVVVDLPKFEHQNPVLPAPVATTSPAKQPISSPNTPGKPEIPPVDSTNLKSSLLLSVPFTPQAPTANWDTIHNEDCEEASAIMANAYYNGPHDAKLEASYVEGQLTQLTNWELQNFGYNLDITSEETAMMIQANYSLQTKILYGFNQDDIKNELAQNHLVLIPANGQLLGNPNYRQPGPKYHMLVIRGYTATSIITNDPGTHNGLNYAYSFDTLYKANGEWSHQTNSVDLSKKNVIAVWPR